MANHVPEVIEKIQSGALTLSSIGEIQRAVKAKETSGQVKVSTRTKQQLVEISVGKSSAQTAVACLKLLDVKPLIIESQKLQQDESRQLTITLTSEQFGKLQQAKDLLANQLLNWGDLSVAATLEALCEFYLRKKTGKSDNEPVRNDLAKPNSEFGNSISAAEMKMNKTLTPKTKKFILNRDGSCRWKDHQTGAICGSRFNLQIDHQKPLWDGGSHATENLRVLCQKHNRWRYLVGS